MPTLPKTKSSERRRASRRNVRLLTAFRFLDKNAPIKNGFARALSLSAAGALLETPDQFEVGQSLEMEFLLDDNRIAKVGGIITRINKRKEFYEVGIEFGKVPAKIKKWIEQQTEG